MSLIIKDGTGTGYSVKVDSHNRLHTRTVALPKSSQASQDGKFFGYTSNELSLTATGGLIAYFKLTGADRFAVVGITASWNGGDTNHNRTLRFNLNVYDDSPTTNITAFSWVNVNLGSTNTLSSTSYIWDGTGDGMTGNTAVFSLGGITIAQGFTKYTFNSEFIMTPGSNIGIVLDPEEAGKASFEIHGYLLD